MQTKPNASESADREHVITRVFDAPARLLFEAYSKREHLMQWFGPRGWPLTTCDLDFRVGGRYRFEMTGPNGEKSPAFGGQYLEIVPNRRIVYDNAFEEPGAETMVITVTFDENGGRTTLTIHTLFGSTAMKASHLGHGYDVGTNSSLDLLGELAAKLVAGERR